MLQEFREKQIFMAVVVDEYGGTAGLVTLEDLIEEILGDIEDETDLPESTKYHAIDKDTIITTGDIEIEDINEIFKSELPEGDDYSTLNGLLHEKLQDIPQEGDKLELGKLRIIVEKVVKNLPEKIRIERIKQ